jgi:hypothetical protein
VTRPAYDPWDHLRLKLRAWLVEEFAGYVNAEQDDAPPAFWDGNADDLIDQLRIFGVQL